MTANQDPPPPSLGNGTHPMNANGIFKMRGFNSSKGSMNLGRGNVVREKDDEEMSQVEESTTSTTTTTANPTVNGHGVGAHGQSFMGVGKDGMWISRKNFLRT